MVMVSLDLHKDAVRSYHSGAIIPQLTKRSNRASGAMVLTSQWRFFHGDDNPAVARRSRESVGREPRAIRIGHWARCTRVVASVASPGPPFARG